MNKYKNILLGIIFLFAWGIIPLSAAESDVQYSDFISSRLNNEYLLENNRLIGLAEGSFAEGKYDEAVKYAQEAILYAQMSDDWIAMQIKIRETNEVIATAQERFDWATDNGAPVRYVEAYKEAETALSDALDARSREDWDTAKESAQKVISILAILPETPVLPAQYLVRNWKTVKDCLWNIAAKPQIYGDPWQWRVIYNANKAKLPRPGNPHLIEPGMILDIPSIKGETRSGLLDER
jgi:tetratricopeptide (TPR) repeat protein